MQQRSSQPADFATWFCLVFVSVQLPCGLALTSGRLQTEPDEVGSYAGWLQEEPEQVVPLLVPRAHRGSLPPWPHPESGVWNGVMAAYTFHSWPARDSWEQTFSKVTGSSADSACSAPVRGIARLSPNGFGSRMNSFANELLVAMYSQQPMALCDPPGFRDDWSRFFEGPGFARCAAESCAWTNPRNATDPSLLAWEAGRFVSETEEETDVEAMKRFVYKHLFVFNTEIQAAADDVLTQLGLQQGSFVGVHIRRGDKEQETVGGVTNEMGTAAYASNVRTFCQTVGTNRVFLASDSAAERAKLQDALGAKYLVVEQPRLAKKIYELRGSVEQGSDIGAHQVIVDAAILVRAAAFVGTSSSNIDRFVYFLRDPSTPVMSMDDSGNFLWRGS